LGYDEANKVDVAPRLSVEEPCGDSGVTSTTVGVIWNEISVLEFEAFFAKNESYKKNC
jgi:hypothetical protein